MGRSRSTTSSRLPAGQAAPTLPMAWSAGKFLFNPYEGHTLVIFAGPGEDGVARSLKVFIDAARPLELCWNAYSILALGIMWRFLAAAATQGPILPPTDVATTSEGADRPPKAEPAVTPSPWAGAIYCWHIDERRWPPIEVADMRLLPATARLLTVALVSDEPGERVLATRQARMPTHFGASLNRQILAQSYASNRPEWLQMVGAQLGRRSPESVAHSAKARCVLEETD